MERKHICLNILLYESNVPVLYYYGINDALRKRNDENKKRKNEN